MLCWSEERIYKLDGDWAEFSPTERSLFTVARKLAASPVVLTDADVATAGTPNVADALLARGLARSYDGGRRDGWCG